MNAIRNVALLCAALLVALGLAEAVLRLSGKPFAASLYTADRTLGWALRPDSEGWVLGEARTYVKINSDGMRDTIHETAKPSGTLRVAFLGDSYTEAFSVEPEQTFWAEAGRRLRQCLTGQRVEVLNFGVSGYGTAQACRMLEAKVWKYRPDVVVLAFYPGNDVFNNHRKLNPSSPEQAPYYQLEHGRLVEDLSFRNLPHLQPEAIRRQAFRSGMINRVRLFQLVYQVKNDLQRRSAQKTVAVHDIEEEMHAPPRRAELEQAWAVTEALMARMHRDAAAHGARFYVAVISTRPQVEPDAARRAAYARRLGVTDLFYPEDRIVEMGRRGGVAVIPLGRPLAAYTLEHNTYVNGGGPVALGEGHWNELGHKLAGERIGAALCNQPAQ